MKLLSKPHSKQSRQLNPSFMHLGFEWALAFCQGITTPQRSMGAPLPVIFVHHF